MAMGGHMRSFRQTAAVNRSDGFGTRWEKVPIGGILTRVARSAVFFLEGSRETMRKYGAAREDPIPAQPKQL